VGASFQGRCAPSIAPYTKAVTRLTSSAGEIGISAVPARACSCASVAAGSSVSIS
jgi:hypothetical protein